MGLKGRIEYISKKPQPLSDGENPPAEVIEPSYIYVTPDEYKKMFPALPPDRYYYLDRIEDLEDEVKALRVWIERVEDQLDGRED